MLHDRNFEIEPHFWKKTKSGILDENVESFKHGPFMLLATIQKSDKNFALKIAHYYHRKVSGGWNASKIGPSFTVVWSESNRLH